MGDIVRQQGVGRLMIYQEARECVDKINSNMNNIRTLILDLYEREGWSALGYQSWRECVTKEFQQNQNYLYRQLEAAQVEKNILPIGKTSERIPESQLRPLVFLRDNPEQQREVWKEAVETAPEGKVTAAHVKAVVDKSIQGDAYEEPEDSDALWNLKRWWKRATKKDRKYFIEWTQQK